MSRDEESDSDTKFSTLFGTHSIFSERLLRAEFRLDTQEGRLKATEELVQEQIKTMHTISNNILQIKYFVIGAVVAVIANTLGLIEAVKLTLGLGG